MSEAALEPLGDGWYRVAGDLSFSTVGALLRQSAAVFERAGASSLHVDLKGVSRADSAGLALLVQWVRSARRGGGGIAFHHVPAQMLAMAEVSRLDTVLPLLRE